MTIHLLVYLFGVLTGVFIIYGIVYFGFQNNYKKLIKKAHNKIDTLSSDEKPLYINRLNQISSLYINDKNIGNLFRLEKEVENIINEIDNKQNEINLEIENNPFDELNKRLAKYKNEEKGRNFEIFVGKYFERLGYKVYYNGIINGRKDEGIDLVAYNKNEVLLIQCKNWNENSKYKIKDKNIKEFIGNCYTFVKNNPKIMNKKVKRLYITSADVFSKSANYFIEQNKDLIQKKILKVN